MKTGRITWGLFLFFCGLYLLTSGGHLYVTDEGAMCFMTESIVDHGWFDVPINDNTQGGKIGSDGLYYMPFGVLQPILAAPFFLLGKSWISWAGAYYIPGLIISWFNVMVTAGLICLMFRFFIDLAVPVHRALFVSLGIGISTSFWVYSQTFFTEPLAALAILASAWELHRFSRTKSYLAIFRSAVWAASMLLIRPITGIALPVLFLYLVLILHRFKTAEKKRLIMPAILIFCCVVLIGIMMFLGYNHLRYGSMLETGYDTLPSGQPRNFTLNPITGSKILLFSPGKSIFVFNPLCIAAVIGLIYGWLKRYQRPLLLLVGIMPAMFILVLSQWVRVEGGVSWGPRLMLPAIPIMLLGLIPLIRDMNFRWIKTVVILAIILGALIQLSGVTVNFATQIVKDYDAYFDPTTGIYQFSFNPIRQHFVYLVKTLSGWEFLDRYPESIAASHRNLIQINIKEGIDFWWIYAWKDHISISFILVNIVFQVTCLILGVLLLGNIQRIRKYE